MRWIDHLRTVRHTFSSNRGRAALTLLGIMIGAGSIVLLAGLLRGGEEALINTNQGANEADMVSIRKDDPPSKQLAKTRRELGRGDEDLLRGSPLLEGAGVAADANKETRALFAAKKKRVRLQGSTPDSLSLYRLAVDQGRFIGPDDLAGNARVCVIGFDVWQDLLEGRDDAVGLALSIADHQWTVVGVLKNKPPLGGGGGDGTWMWNRKVLVPQTTFDALYQTDHTRNRLFVRLGSLGAPGDGKLGVMEGIVKGTILRRHYGVENFKVEGEDGQANQERLILTIIEMLLLGTGLLSLFVGGINIMNIMLVTVTERTREIGVRRAIGAAPGQVLMQFLLEASIIALTGGVLGVLGGMFMAWLIALLLTHVLGQWTLHIETWSILLGLGLSLSTGVVFGMFPAWRASRLDPVEALRFE